MSRWLSIAIPLAVALALGTPSQARNYCHYDCTAASACDHACWECEDRDDCQFAWPSTCGSYGVCATCDSTCDATSACDDTCWEGGVSTTCGSHGSCDALCADVCTGTTECGASCWSGNSTTSCGSYGTCDVDEDGDGIGQALEATIAAKYSPVLHRAPEELQEGLADIDEVLDHHSRLRGANVLGQILYDERTPPLHVTSSWKWDSLGTGSVWTGWKLDFDDDIRYAGAPVGSRPLYYHVYRDDDHYYVQYWYFLTMNDLFDMTNNRTWHEGDWEHITLKLDDDAEFTPVAVNFYQHLGGHTKTPAECWWSSSTASTYNGLHQGYSSSRTHPHVWIAANAHASYNRYDDVYHIVVDDAGLFGHLDTDEDYTDVVDYEPHGSDLYFDYDLLVNMGEIRETPRQRTSEGYYLPHAHGYFWFTHFEPDGPVSKDWLAFNGRFGEYWTQVIVSVIPPLPPVVSTTPSPLSPAFGDHEWTDFTVDYSAAGFGNEGTPPFAIIDWVPVPGSGGSPPRAE